MSQHRFASTLDLARLPWFEVRDGRLHTDPDVGPIADVHTHLALAYGRRMPLDLRARTGPTQHYLAMERPIDLDIYANRNFTPAGLAAMKKDLGLMGLTRRGMRCTHNLPNLRGEMADLGIGVSLLLPVELPLISWNAEVYLEVTAGSHDVRSLGSVHPHGRRNADRLAAQKAAGALGVKLHPAVQLVPADHPRAMALYRICADLDLPVLWHCGPVDIEPALGRRCAQLHHYWQAVHEHPDTTFVLGHAGALQMEQGLELAQRYPNVWLEIASQSLTNVARIVREGPADRMMFGSDWPFYHQGLPLAKALLATEGEPAKRAQLLWENAARLFGLRLPA